MNVSFLTPKIFGKALCKALIFNKKFEGCPLEIDLMKKGLRLIEISIDFRRHKTLEIDLMKKGLRREGVANVNHKHRPLEIDLMKKGLRLLFRGMVSLERDSRNRPDEKGIKTAELRQSQHPCQL
nr:hypothetical protein HGMM_F34F03C28 [uncultured Gammaproteobacteria bacterium]